MYILDRLDTPKSHARTLKVETPKKSFLVSRLPLLARVCSTHSVCVYRRYTFFLYICTYQYLFCVTDTTMVTHVFGTPDKERRRRLPEDATAIIVYSQVIFIAFAVNSPSAGAEQSLAVFLISAPDTSPVPSPSLSVPFVYSLFLPPSLFPPPNAHTILLYLLSFVPE